MAMRSHYCGLVTEALMGETVTLCGWVNRRCFENSWGDSVCRGGRYTCWRPTYCD